VNSEMIKGYIDAIILSVLARGDTYGYEIAKQVTEQTAELFELKEGTLYPALKRLEANGLIEGYYPTGQKDSRRRRYYTITDLGRKRLEESKLSWQQNIRVIGKFLGGSAGWNNG